MQIKITSRPPGEAPEEIRDKWIGLTIPLIENLDQEEDALVAGVLSCEFKIVQGYTVSWTDAMNALDDASRHWWETNVGTRFGMTSLTFDKNCCEVVQ